MRLLGRSRFRAGCFEGGAVRSAGRHSLITGRNVEHRALGVRIVQLIGDGASFICARAPVVRVVYRRQVDHCCERSLRVGMNAERSMPPMVRWLLNVAGAVTLSRPVAAMCRGARLSAGREYAHAPPAAPGGGEAVPPAQGGVRGCSLLADPGTPACPVGSNEGAASVLFDPNHSEAH